MGGNKFRTEFYKMFYKNKDFSLIELLNNSSCDEIAEIDFIDDKFTRYYHVEGKYFVPTVDFSFEGLFDFVAEHIVHPDDRQIYIDFMKTDGIFERLKNAEIPNFDYCHFRYKLQDGSYRYVEQCIITGEENGIKNGVVRVYVFDIENLKTRQLGAISEEKNIISKDRDQLTGLLVEKYFILKADEMVQTHPETKWCLISLDIEHFKFYDQWYGRDAGNLLLANIGAVLSENNALYHGFSGYFGQDDFSILAEYDLQIINALYEKIRDVIVSFGSSFGFMPSFGVAIYEKGMTTVDAFNQATIAASRAKKDIRNKICIYNPDMQFQAVNEYRILNEYISAFKNDEITFYLQPQCHISTGKIVGAESLARWIKKDGTIVPPNDYIPTLEKYGFITDLDQRLWEKVCIWLRKWIDKGHKPVPISVNVSRTDIFSIDIFAHFEELTKKYNLPHNLIKIEITESAYTETTSLIGELVRKLRKNGFLVLMDDFGSGYSSLNMLSNLKVDAIKLDANFLHIKGADFQKGIHILESVVNMAKMIAIPIIVEGVELKDQRDFLEDLGCRYAQGYYFHRPMPIEKFEKLISIEHNIDSRGFVVKLNEQFRLREFLDKNIYSDAMLNNIIGAVAFYHWKKGEGTDIVRFNEQFYRSVDVPDFHERLSHIERFLPPEDAPLMEQAFEKAMENRLFGYTQILHFYKTDGTLTSYSMHFYYLGHKEGGERFYGSANNVTELTDLKEEMELIAKYGHDNMIFIRKVYDKWVYNVASHGLSDLFNLSPKELELELNDGRFAKRIIDGNELIKFMKQVEKYAKEKKDFVKRFLVLDKDNNKRIIELSFTCTHDLTNNIEYILNSKIVD